MRLFVSSIVMVFSFAAFAEKSPLVIQQEKLESLMFNTSKIERETNEKLVSFLKCVRKEARQKDLTEEGRQHLINITSSILSDGSLEDESRIMVAEESCRKQDKNFDVGDKSSLVKAEALIDKMIHPSFVCKSYSAEVAAALLIGVNVGGALYQCHGTDGSVRLYAGPKLGLSIGLGVNATVHKRSEWDNNESSNEVTEDDFFAVMGGAELKYGLLVARSADLEGKGIGLGINYDGFVVPVSRVGARRSRYHVIQKFLQE